MPNLSQRVCFDPFEVNLRSGELRKHGVKVKLHHQPFVILAMLLERPGEVVTREELRRRLWPSDTFVDFDVGLNSAVKKLRDALGDSAETPRYVETLSRRGYRFIGSLSHAAASRGKASSSLPESLGQEDLTVASESPSAVMPPASGTRNRWMGWAIAASLAGLLILLLWLYAGGFRGRLPSRATPSRINSIAVLPLENLSGDPAQDYFTDGMTDALITDLAQISALRVISRTSMMRYKGTRKTIPEIARELNVDAIVEGSVVQSAGHVRVNAQLIHAVTDQHVWASAYERNLGDVVALQNEVAGAIANAIQVQLTPQEQVRLAQKRSVDAQAYEFYLKGRYFWRKRTDDSVRKSIDYFQKAIERDPNYAPAYAGLAEAYIVQEDLSPTKTYPKAKTAARTALQMDEGLAEAHNALAMISFMYEWDWAGAEKEFQRAIALNPNYAQVHQWYGQYQHAMGWKNWADEVKHAGELDPLSLVTAGGGWYIESGQYDQALEIQRRKQELDPDSPLPHLNLGRIYTLKAMYPEAIEELQKSVDLSRGTAEYLSALGYSYGMSGNRGQAMKTLQALTSLSERTYVSPYNIAFVYVGLKDKDLAFDWLQKAVEDRSIPLVSLRSAKELEILRSDPRYSELIRRIGLPQ
jgi:TolB-like protein/DNA-binding winged helix-turn-helix (wHTH) protein/Tfp pilus assembly protein PilF